MTNIDPREINSTVTGTDTPADNASVVPEISPAGNELPHPDQAQEGTAQQGPAPVNVDRSGPGVDIDPSDRPLSAGEVAGMTGGEGAAEANEALSRAQGRSEPSES